MAAPQVVGVPRSLARYRSVAAEAAIMRLVAGRIINETPADRTAREVPDRHQMRGANVIVIRSPAWPREDWAKPQRRRVRP